jgi:asparagine synthase (glutamine-hydrolysing)
MCGIFGFLLKRPLNPDDLARGQSALEGLEHRGPDGTEFWVDEKLGVFLGHTRLAIIDIGPDNRQPMADGPAVLTYNGEVYNYLELRQELEAKGNKFRTSGDVEVVLRSWRKWGPDSLDRFDGMFAFAVYEEGQLHLATDPFGEKPLYWCQTHEGVYFASEAQILTDLLDLPFDPTAAETAHFMTLGFMPPPMTGYRGLKTMAPATYQVLNPDGPVSRRTYWTPQPSKPGRGRIPSIKETDVDLVHGELVKSLQRRVRSDVPLGLFLSGGVDSQLIGALSVKDLGLDIEALTVSFPDGHDESGVAAKMAAKLSLRHRIVNSLESVNTCSGPDQLRELYGTPNDNTTALSIRQMSAVARHYMKVALGGLGGDELFYGYGRHEFMFRQRLWYATAPLIVNAFGPAGDALVSGSRHWRRARSLFSGNKRQQYLALKNGVAWEALAAIDGIDDVAADIFGENDAALAFSARDFDVRCVMPGSYIPSIDRGSMREGLEVRAPFLSRDLYNSISSIDQRVMMAHGPKEILRRILSRYLPRHMIDHPKKGFVFPGHRFLDSRGVNVPVVPNMSATVVERVWRRRYEPFYTPLAIRLTVLETYFADAAKTGARAVKGTA